MISISTPTFDLDGSWVFQNTEETNFTDISRRSSRTATLDGSVSIQDSGFCEGDRTFDIIQTNPTQADVDFCNYIVKNYSSVNVSCSDGVFTANPQSFRIDNRGNAKLTLLIQEKLSA